MSDFSSLRQERVSTVTSEEQQPSTTTIKHDLQDGADDVYDTMEYHPHTVAIQSEKSPTSSCFLYVELRLS